MSKQIDITTELNRTYHYPSGATFTIQGPQTLTVLTDESGASHRVAAADGRTYCPERGWIGISWLSRAGAPAFVA